ncbi:hypothetical protein AB6N31_06040 [Fusobacterium animalis]
MKSKEGTLKIGKNRKLIEYVENSMLNDRNSPYIALEKAKKENITDISEISEEEIKEIEKWMNDYPRKLFNGKSANEMYLSEFTKYFS